MINEPRYSERIEPKWKVYRVPENLLKLNDGLKTLRKPLKTVEKVLKTIQKVLNKAKAIIQILAIFESAFNNLLYSFINTILDKFQGILNDAKSTGVYMLDLVSYHITNDSDTEPITDKNYEQIINMAPWFAGNETKTAGTPAPKTPPTPPTIIDAVSENFQNLFENIGKGYRRETYNEFIQVICDAFEDKYDLPSGALAYQTFGKEVEPGKPNDIVLWDARWLQSGRPDLGPQGTLNVTLLVFAAPGFDDIYRVMMGIQALLGELPGNAKNFFGVNSIIHDWWKKTSTTPGNSILQQARNFELQQVWEKTHGVLSGTRGKDPNFVGINLYSLLAPVFDTIQNLIDTARSFSYRVDTELTDMLLDIIIAIEEEIERLVRIIMMINHFITMIESILAITGLRILNFTTQEGTAGVVRALKNAKNFGEGEDRDALNKIEAGRQQKMQKEISDKTKEIEAQTIVNQKLNTKKTNLEELNTMVLAWADYVYNNPEVDLETKEIALEDLKVSSSEAIEAKEEEIEAVEETHNDIPGLDWKKNVIITEHDWELNGRDVTGDGHKDIKGLLEEKAELEAELQSLIDQYNDPTQPEPEDYIERIERLVIIIAGLQSQIDASILQFDKDIEDNEWVKDTILASPDPYSTQLIATQQLLEETREDKDPYHPGSTGESFRILDESYDAQIQSSIDTIELLEQEKIDKLNEKGTLHGSIATNSIGTIDPRDWDKNIYRGAPIWSDVLLPNLCLDVDALQFPPTNMGFKNNAYWNTPYDPGELGFVTYYRGANAIVFHQYYTGSWGSQPSNNISGEFFDMYIGLDPVINMTIYNLFQDYWNCEIRLEEIEVELAAEHVTLSDLEDAKDLNLETWEIFNYYNVRIQQRIEEKRLTLQTEIEKDILIEEKNVIIVESSEEIEQKEEEINNIIESAWDIYLSESYKFYKYKVPRTIRQEEDGPEILEDWTNNEIGYLIRQSNYDLRKPKVEIIPGGFRCLPILNALAVLDDEIEADNFRLASAESQKQFLIEQEENRVKDFEQKALVGWTADTKMYYGGYLFCAGWPDVTDSNYFNFSDIYSSHKKAGIDAKRDGWNQIKTFIG